MKIILVFLTSLFWANICSAQVAGSYPTVKVGKNTTTMLVFPTAIKDADRGSSDIIIQPVKNARHVLKVKAAKDSFLPTNVTVFTLDDRMYTVSVQFDAEPQELSYNFTGLPLNEPPPTSQGLNESEIAQAANIIVGLKPLRKKPTHSAYSMQCKLTGIYVKNGTIFFQFFLKNNSNIPFYLDFIRCYQRDKLKAKRSSQMEKEIIPSHFKQQATLDGHQGAYYVAAFDQFTIANNKVFAIECFEKNGDRHMSLRLKGKHILRAQVIR